MEPWSLELPEERIRKLTARLTECWNEVDGQSITLFGGTGFIGSWLSTVLLTAIQDGIDLKLNIVSRKTSRVFEKFGQSLPRKVFNHATDITEPIPISLLDVNHIVIASTSTSQRHANPKLMTLGAQNLVSILKQVVQAQSLPIRNLLHLSSGAVYAGYGSTQIPLQETDDVVDDSKNPYIQAKRLIENGIKNATETCPWITYSNPRLFAFYGEGLPLEEHFAIGNFLGNIANSQPVRVKGNRQTTRSYLHVADLTFTLLSLLTRPFAGPLNLGSTRAWTMEDLAEFVAQNFNSDLVFEDKEPHASFYVPNTDQATRWLGNIESIDFKEGLGEWLDWIRRRR